MPPAPRYSSIKMETCIQRKEKGRGEEGIKALIEMEKVGVHKEKHPLWEKGPGNQPLKGKEIPFHEKGGQIQVVVKKLPQNLVDGKPREERSISKKEGERASASALIPTKGSVYYLIILLKGKE